MAYLYLMERDLNRVIDERSELSGMYNGEPQHSIGIRTDVLDGCNKKKMELQC